MLSPFSSKKDAVFANLRLRHIKSTRSGLLIGYKQLSNAIIPTTKQESSLFVFSRELQHPVPFPLGYHQIDNNIMKLKFQQNILQLLLVANVAEAFRVGGSTHVRRINTLRSSTLEEQDAKAKAPAPKKKKKPVYIKNEREQIAKKKDFYRGAGVFRDVKAEVTKDMKKQFDSALMNEMKQNPNYKIERDGAEFYLAKDHGFCWGVERSINLAYSAVETFPEAKVHITNELIHNPMVNDRLHSKNVNFIKKDDENVKDFSDIEEGDVVMLPAFGATLDEMK